jgi:tetratricopeptide (TPR) repeat protein
MDVALEQGPLGLLAFAGVMGGSLLLLVQYQAGDRRIKHLSLLRWAIGSSLIILLLHGLIDDPLYGSRAVLFLFLIPGLVVAIVRLNGSEGREKRKRKRRNRPINLRTITAAGAAVLVLILILAFSNRNTLLSDWYANVGAVDMARVELADWPTDQWDEGQNVALLAPAEALFNKALTYNPNNATAHYRLGLISMLRRDYQTAITHLDTAYQIQPNNRGVIKSLGYSYTWVGDFDHAYINLRRFREAPQEMAIYVNWWRTQGRPDLSEYAAVMEERLQTIEARPSR